MAKASDLLVSALENEGMDRVFRAPGEEDLDVLESLRRSGIRLALPRHERRHPLEAGGAEGMADFGMTFSNPDFVRYAEAYGATGHRVGAAEDLVHALEAAFRAGGVHLPRGRTSGSVRHECRGARRGAAPGGPHGPRSRSGRRGDQRRRRPQPSLRILPPRILAGRFADGHPMAEARQDLPSGAGVSARPGFPLPVLAAATGRAALLRRRGGEDKGGMARRLGAPLGAELRGRRSGQAWSLHGRCP